jgi:hypothetical protein
VQWRADAAAAARERALAQVVADVAVRTGALRLR